MQRFHFQINYFYDANVTSGKDWFVQPRINGKTGLIKERSIMSIQYLDRNCSCKSSTNYIRVDFLVHHTTHATWLFTKSVNSSAPGSYVYNFQCWIVTPNLTILLFFSQYLVWVLSSDCIQVAATDIGANRKKDLLGSLTASDVTRPQCVICIICVNHGDDDDDDDDDAEMTTTKVMKMIMMVIMMMVIMMMTIMMMVIMIMMMMMVIKWYISKKSVMLFVIEW